MVARRTLVTVFLLVLLGGCAVTGEPRQLNWSELRRVEPGESITQTVVPRGNRFALLDVFIATYGVEVPDTVIRLEVRGSGETREALIGHNGLEDNGWVTFVFEPIAGSSDETFEAQFTVLGNDPIGFYVNPADGYAAGELMPGPGDLAFRIGHAGRVAGTLEATGRIVSEFTANLRQDAAFLVVWLLAIVGLGAALIRSFRGRRPDDPPTREDAAVR